MPEINTNDRLDNLLEDIKILLENVFNLRTDLGTLHYKLTGKNHPYKYTSVELEERAILPALEECLSIMDGLTTESRNLLEDVVVVE